MLYEDPEGGYPTRVAEGDYPLVFDAPYYDLHSNIELPALVDVQPAAFAHELQATPTTRRIMKLGRPSLPRPSSPRAPSGPAEK